MENFKPADIFHGQDKKRELHGLGAPEGSKPVTGEDIKAYQALQTESAKSSGIKPETWEEIAGAPAEEGDFSGLTPAEIERATTIEEIKTGHIREIRAEKGEKIVEPKAKAAGQR